MLAFLDSLAGVVSVERFSLQSEVPLAESVAHAIAGAIPNLSTVDLRCRAPDNPDAEQHGGDVLLLKLVGPKLKHLGLYIHDGYWSGRALETLTICTALTQLSFYLDWDRAEHEYGLAAETSLLRTISSLTGLRNLRMWGGTKPPASPSVRQARAASLESCLSALTALTSLDIHVRCLAHSPHPEMATDDEEDVEEEVAELRSEGRAEEAERLLAAVAAESCALAAALRCMPQLRELRTQARINAADLAPLTALTYLRLGAIVVPPRPARAAAAAEAVVQLPVYDMPPVLRQLKVYAPLPVRVAASLRQSPAAASAGQPLIFWQAPGIVSNGVEQPYWTLAFDGSDLDGQGRLTAQSVANAHKAVVNLKSTFSRVTDPESDSEPRGLHIRILGKHTAYVQPPAAGAAPAPAAGTGTAAALVAGGGDGTHCGSWLGAMMLQLQPEEVALRGFSLTPRDMLGLARCIAGVTRLSLYGCRHSVSCLPLLGGLGALKSLTLFYGGWTWPAGAVAHDALEAAFLGLTAPAARMGRWVTEDADVDALYESEAALPLPRLERLTVYCEAGATEDWLRAGLAAATAELRRRRPEPAELVVAAL